MQTLYKILATSRKLIQVSQKRGLAKGKGKED